MKYPIFLMLVLAMAFGLTACQTNEAGPVGPATTGANVNTVAKARSMPAQTTGSVTVIHGVPGLIVDVYVNGNLTLPGFTPGTVTPVLELPEGNYEIVIVPEGGDIAAPAISGSAFLPAGANVSIVAHLDGAGTPALGVFVNDVSAIQPGKTRLVVRHTAAAPPVDVALYRGANTKNYQATIRDLANGSQAAVDIRPGRYGATLAPAGDPVPVFGPASVVLNPKTMNIVYAVGSLSDGSFTLITQTIGLKFGR